MDLSRNDLFLLSQCAIAAAYRAGHLIAEHAQRRVTVNTKSGGTSLAGQVVTEVDHLSQEVILRSLQPTCTMFDVALLSEESPDDHTRLSKDYFWSIDPLDGTLPFIEGVAGYSVSIALVSREGLPLIGVVYDPLSQTLYHALTDQGAWRNGQAIEPKLMFKATDTHQDAHDAGADLSAANRRRQNSFDPLPEAGPNLKPSKSAAHSPAPKLVFITDKSFAQDLLYPATLIELERIAEELGYAGAELRLQGGAALNACQVLNTPPACYFKFPKAQPGGGSVWDYAATSCLFREAGVPVSDIFGKPLILNPDGSTFMNHCGVLYSSDPAIAERMLRAYGTLMQA